MADQRHLVTLLFVNIRRLQPTTREAIVKALESGDSFGVIECTPEEMDAIKVVPFMPLERKSLAKVLRPKAPPVVKENEAEATAAAIEDLIEGSDPKS